MENPWNNAFDSSSQILKPELNPSLNPTLARNLERWAQTYFTSPPELREQAVADLLRELESEDRRTTSSEIDSSEPSSGPTGKRDVTDKRLTTEGRQTDDRNVARGELTPAVLLTLCPACHHENEPSHKFCVNCGSPLSDFPREPGNTNPVPVEGAVLPSFSRETDLEWLRGRALSASPEPENPAPRTWGYVIVGAAVLLGGLIYAGWNLRPNPGNVPQPLAQAPLPVMGVKPQPVPTEAPPANPTSNPPSSTEVTSSQATPTELASNSAAIPSENGAQELAMAQSYLEQSAGTRDTAQAAKWLWKAVGKQNTTAALLLADLYVRGDGVVKSCDQARVLLTAAAKRGATEAEQKLRDLESGSCNENRK